MYERRDLLILLAFLAAAILVVYYFYVAKVGAVAPTPYKIICHHNAAQDVTLQFANANAYSGHLGTPHNDQTFDTDGECVNVSPTVEPTIEPTVEPSITPEVSATPSASIAPSVTVNAGSDGRSDGRSDGKSDGRSSAPQPTIIPCGANNCGWK